MKKIKSFVWKITEKILYGIGWIAGFGLAVFHDLKGDLTTWLANIENATK